MSTSPVTTPPSTGTASSGLPTSASLNNMFLQLLVAQLQNQDPLDPLDPSQFVGQLAQFSELSEVTSINQELQQLIPSSSSSSSSSNASTAGSSGPNANASIAAAAAGLATPSGPTSLATPSALGLIPNAGSATSTVFSNLSAPASAAVSGKLQGGF
jgi:flagellar basal-body rod modification protein FlgD